MFCALRTENFSVADSGSLAHGTFGLALDAQVRVTGCPTCQWVVDRGAEVGNKSGKMGTRAFAAAGEWKLFVVWT